MGKVIFEDEEMEETTDSSDLSYDCRELWMSTQDDTAPMADRNEAAAQLISKAEGGDSSAQYLVGRLYQDGPVLIPDSVETQYWFAQSARQGHVPAQYELGKLLLSNDPEVQDQALGIQWLEHLTQSAVQGNEYAQFFLDRRDSLKPPTVMLSVTRLLHHMSELFQDNSVPPQAPVGQQADRKLRIKIREKKIAMGHKAGDHEEYNGPSMSM